MANLSKIKRDRMIEFLEQLKKQHSDDASIRAFNEIENQLRDKKYGLVWEEHSEQVDDTLKENIPVLVADKERRLCKDKSLPWNFIIEGDNLQALYLLEKTHKGKIDCIYIDPPYNTGARDWKYNNDYVDGNDVYRHSKWLSMMKSRLVVAKELLNPEDSVLICTIDEKEYMHLACLLEELFPTAKMQMVSSVINVKGVARDKEFARVNEYIFFIQLGDAEVSKLSLSEEWMGNIKSSGRNGVRLAGLLRSGTGSSRKDSPGCFYPIIFYKSGKFKKIGQVLGKEESRDSVKLADDEIAIWPIHKDGTEGRWMYTPSGLAKLIEKGYVYFGKITGDRMGILYAPRGVQEKIEQGLFKIKGFDDNGGAIIDDSEYEASYIPGNQWSIPSHNATEYGTKLIQDILLSKRFTFPKSLYAVHDAVRFFVASKPNAIVLDFFAGSGTTGHAVNLLNAEDEGHRTWIMVTNNEISEAEAKEFEQQGIKKGDKAWEEKGIAKYVTWPRTICSINGVDVDGNALKGDYIGSNIPMSDGFNANVKYLKCEWTPRKPQDYLLSNALGLHIKEMIELQYAIEIDNEKNVLILNKADFKNVFGDKKTIDQIENIWVNQNIVFNASELKMLKSKQYKYIPKEFFGQELREAAE